MGTRTRTLGKLDTIKTTELLHVVTLAPYFLKLLLLVAVVLTKTTTTEEPDLEAWRLGSRPRPNRTRS